ncbi:hypothetical protein EV702DRAFT_174854 [Suillus placidus]|uniref:Uncharacterized protein n=1 Tax=Suillus placidus TaxID=48579 RepID=A0A9P6ZX46_9AGAM|nr:hypothetical protein EV702DRAFT_174854 [Suillus placidus]
MSSTVRLEIYIPRHSMDSVQQQVQFVQTPRSRAASLKHPTYTVTTILQTSESWLAPRVLILTVFLPKHTILHVPGEGSCTSSLASRPLTLYDLNVISMLSKDNRELAMNREGANLNDIIHHHQGGKNLRRAQLNGGAQNWMLLRLLRLQEALSILPRSHYSRILGRISSIFQGGLQMCRTCRAPWDVAHSRVFHIPTCSCLLSDISRINHLEYLGRSSSPPSTKISDITAFQPDCSYLYQRSHYSTSFIV